MTSRALTQQQKERLAALAPFEDDEDAQYLSHTRRAMAEGRLAGQLEEVAATRRTGWVLAIVLILVCAAQAAAIAIMLPLREIVPLTILVDKQTGYVETVRGVKLGELPEDEAVTHAFLAQYVIARETFDAVDLKDRYRQVVLWSADGARGDYVDSWRADNPLGLLGAYEATTIVRVRVAAVELLGPGAARVRFESIRRDPGAREAAPERWTATLAFRYTGKPLRMEDRLINPLGFQVVSYRRDATVNAPQPITRDPAGTAAPGASVLEIQVTPPAAVAPVPDEAAGAAAVASAPSPVSTTSAKPAAEPTAPADAPLRTAPGAQKTQAEQAAPAKPKPKPPAKPPGGPKAADIPEGPNP